MPVATKLYLPITEIAQASNFGTVKPASEDMVDLKAYRAENNLDLFSGEPLTAEQVKELGIDNEDEDDGCRGCY